MATLDPMPRDPVPESLTPYLKADETVQSVIGAQTRSTYLIGGLNAVLWILTVIMVFEGNAGSEGVRSFLVTPFVVFVLLFVGDLAEPWIGGLTRGTYILGFFIAAITAFDLIGLLILSNHEYLLRVMSLVGIVDLLVLLALFSLNRFRILAVTSQRILVLDTGRTNWKKGRGVVTELPSSTHWDLPSGVWWSAIPVGHEKLRVSRRFFKNLQPAALTK